MNVYLIDGAYELFQHYRALPSERDAEGREVAALRGVVRSILGMINRGADYLAVATQDVGKSFRNQLLPDYKTTAGFPSELLAQFPLFEEALADAGIVVWPMREYEAADALASAAVSAALDAAVKSVFLCTAKHTLAQCVYGSRVVLLNRWAGTLSDEARVVERFGIRPCSIPDYLALVGDTNAGYDGVSGWTRKSAAAVLARFVHLESIPADFWEWGIDTGSGASLAKSLSHQGKRALLFRQLATLRTDLVLFDNVSDLLSRGPTPAYSALRGSPVRVAYRK